MLRCDIQARGETFRCVRCKTEYQSPDVKAVCPTTGNPRLTAPCPHRRDVVDSARCTCGIDVPVWRCTKHKFCAHRDVTWECDVHVCTTCGH